MNFIFDLFLTEVSSMASFRTFEIVQNWMMIQFASEYSWWSLLCYTACYNSFRCWLTCSWCRFFIFYSTNSTPHWLDPMSRIWWSHSPLKKSSLSSKFCYWRLSAVILLIWLAKKPTKLSMQRPEIEKLQSILHSTLYYLIYSFIMKCNILESLMTMGTWRPLKSRRDKLVQATLIAM